MAEGILAARMKALGLSGQVHSAGLLRAGQPASASSVDLLAQRGIDASGHRSTTMTARLLDESDLVVGMAREHVREAVVTAPGCWPYAFTLKELVRRATDIGPRCAGQSVSDWLAALHAGRRTADLMGSSTADDVADPIGQHRSVYVAMVDEVEGLVDSLCRLLWAPESAQAAGAAPGAGNKAATREGSRP